jgi:hypothetical protein
MSDKGFCEGLLDFSLRHPRAGRRNLREAPNRTRMATVNARIADIDWFLGELEGLREKCQARDSGKEVAG